MDLHRNRVKDYATSLVVFSLALVLICASADSCGPIFIVIYVATTASMAIALDFYIMPARISATEEGLSFEFIKRKKITCPYDDIQNIRYPLYYGPAQIRIYLKKRDRLEFVLGSFSKDRMVELIGLASAHV